MHAGQRKIRVEATSDDPSPRHICRNNSSSLTSLAVAMPVAKKETLWQHLRIYRHRILVTVGKLRPVQSGQTVVETWLAR
jgi:hypothetical protein